MSSPEAIEVGVGTNGDVLEGIAVAHAPERLDLGGGSPDVEGEARDGEVHLPADPHAVAGAVEEADEEDSATHPGLLGHEADGNEEEAEDSADRVVHGGNVHEPGRPV